MTTKQNIILNKNFMFCGHKLESRIMNASGVHCTTLQQLNDLDQNPNVCAIVSKSCTIDPCEGNMGKRYHFDKKLKASINSTGLANLGSEFYLNYKKKSDKPYIVSIAGKSKEELYTLIDLASKSKVDYIEVNASCPNVIGKSQIAYNFEDFRELVNYCNSRIKSKYYGIKLPPFFDQFHFKQISDFLNHSYKIAYRPNWITCINSPGNGFIFNDLRPSIDPNGGYGGIGGNIIKPFALSNVRIFRELLNEHISIIGCGGVSSKKDVLEHLAVGADIVQVGTYLHENGMSVFEELNINNYGRKFKN